MIRLFVLVVFMLLNGCATVFSGTTQSINVQVVDEENNVLKKVKCTIIDGKGGSYILPSNPGIITVNRSQGPLTPSCKKPGYTQRNFGTGESFNKVTLVNIIWWPGLIVDALSGAMSQYPSHVTVFMEKDSSNK